MIQMSLDLIKGVACLLKVFSWFCSTASLEFGTLGFVKFERAIWRWSRHWVQLGDWFEALDEWAMLRSVLQKFFGHKEPLNLKIGKFPFKCKTSYCKLKNFRNSSSDLMIAFVIRMIARVLSCGVLSRSSLLVCSPGVLSWSPLLKFPPKSPLYCSQLKAHKRPMLQLVEQAVDHF